MLAVLGAATAAVHPPEPHWYLGVLATRPDRQSRGLGARILAPILSLRDGEAVPAYLESFNARNIAFYERQWFDVRGEIVTPEGPTLYPMRRGPT